ncbi:uncharacterized protein LOC143211728 [Lasioglossum baleicum]|uniref:uncharacterized protein LOC143211728 n=1 Tax=Lasioglossum baleicum TaxID=434251 RepID=UPI003FCDFD5B
MSMQVVLAICATFEVANNFLLLIINLTEWSLTLSLLPSMFLIRLSKSLELIVDKITKEIKDESIFENDEEKRLYHKYNNLSYKFGKYATLFQLSIVTLMFCRPLIHLLVYSHSEIATNDDKYFFLYCIVAGHGNITQPYHLPYVVTFFVDHRYNSRLYFSLYLIEVPANYVPMFHIAEVSFIVTLVLHVCGRFSILSSRIRKIPTHSLNLYQDNIKRIVREHIELRK